MVQVLEIHDMEMLFALLAFCVGNPSVTIVTSESRWQRTTNTELFSLALAEAVELSRWRCVEMPWRSCGINVMQVWTQSDKIR